jgi:GT2 family glycosyltransferase
MFEDLLFNNVVTGSASSSMVRRECFDRVGVFDETLRSLEDLDLWLRIARCYDFQRVDEPLTKIRHHESNMQVNVDRMAEGWTAYLAKRQVPDQYKRAERLATYEALVRIARQYRQLGRMHMYAYYAARALAARPRQVLDARFWRSFVGSHLGNTGSTGKNWVTRTLKR